MMIQRARIVTMVKTVFMHESLICMYMFIPLALCMHYRVCSSACISLFELSVAPEKSPIDYFATHRVGPGGRLVGDWTDVCVKWV